MVIIEFVTSDYDGQRFGSVWDIQSYDNSIMTSAYDMKRFDPKWRFAPPALQGVI